MCGEMGHEARNLAQIRAAREDRYRCPECYRIPEFRPNDRAVCHRCGERYDLEELVDVHGGESDV